MAFKKGQSGNPTGRKPGTPNNATATAREAISAALDKATAGRLAAALDALTGKEYIDAYVKLAEFVTHKAAHGPGYRGGHSEGSHHERPCSQFRYSAGLR